MSSFDFLLLKEVQLTGIPCLIDKISTDPGENQTLSDLGLQTGDEIIVAILGYCKMMGTCVTCGTNQKLIVEDEASIDLKLVPIESCLMNDPLITSHSSTCR